MVIIGYQTHLNPIRAGFLDKFLCKGLNHEAVIFCDGIVNINDQAEYFPVAQIRKHAALDCSTQRSGNNASNIQMILSWYIKRSRAFALLLYYARYFRTKTFTVRPSPLPLTFSMMAGINLPISFILVAPVSEMVSFTIVSNSSSESCEGK